MKTFRDLSVAISILAIAASILITSIRLDSAIKELQYAISELSEYIAIHKAALSDPKNKKALDAAIQAAAVYNATGRQINTLVIPRVMRTLDSLDGSIRSLDSLIQHSDESINKELLPNLNRVIAHGSIMLESANPKVQNILDNAEAVTVNIDETTRELVLVTKNGTRITDATAKVTEDAASISSRFAYPKPAPWWKRYILSPLKTVGGITWLIVSASR